ncbi:MAG: tetratricopeptide repeat protein [Flavobacteriales bacterium]
MNFSRKAYTLSVVILVMVAAACSTKRDSTAARLYHNTTAHYNGYFNAEEAVKKGVEKIKVAYKDDYDKVLPIFVYGDEETAKAAYPDMEKAITKCEKVITKHTINSEAKKNDKENPEFNKWIDENYMVIGRAYFYKRNYARATDTFKGVNARFKDNAAQVKSSTWLARTYIQKEEYSKAIQALQRIEEEDEETDEGLRAEYHLVYADVYMHQDKPEKAAEQIEKALPLIKKKKDRARPHFILAQLYQQMNRSSDALTHYEATIKSRPPYELEFYARINKALAYSRTGGSSDEIQKALFKMLRDEKNVNYQDQIYYALGDLAWEEQRRADALGYYQKSLDTNKDNPKQRAKTFLRLADIYFGERQYKPAQAYYDSTLTKITDKHDRYEEIKNLAENLNELIENLEKIELYDSLGVICNLSPVEREKKLADIQKKLEREKQEQRRKDEEAAAKQNENNVAAISSAFWAYNENLRKSGKENFADKWGDRPLKDNWRLQSRLSLNSEPGEEADPTATDTSESSAELDDKYKVPTIDELKSGLPCDDKARLEQMKKDAAEGYYLAGVVYKEKFDDDDNAIGTWEELLANMENSDYHPTTYYQLYRTWLSKETTKGYLKNPLCNTCNSAYWANEIKTRYPDSDWAYLVDNPDYTDMQEIKKREESKSYEAVYAMYADRDFYQVKSIADSVIYNEPDNHLVCKYRLLRAICVGYTDAPYGEKQNYQRELNELVTKCAGSDEAKRAQDLLRAFSTGDTGNLPEEKTDESTGTDNKIKPEPSDSSATKAPDGPFKYDESAEHYLALIMPVQGTDINKMKSAVSDFNSEVFASSALKVTNNLLNKEQHLLLVKSFKLIEEANIYLGTFQADGGVLKDVNNDLNISFLISKQNYIALFKSKDLEGYLMFYDANYNK